VCLVDGAQALEVHMRLAGVYSVFVDAALEKA